LSTVEQTLHCYGNLFCELHDELDDAAFEQNIERWSDAFLDSAAKGVASEVADGASVQRLRGRLSASPEPDRDRLAVLMGLDRAFAAVNPAFQGSKEEIAAPLAALAIEVVASGRLDSGRHGGALLLRHTRPSVTANLPEHPRDAFRYVVRVPEEAWRRVEHVVLGPSAGIWRRELEPAVKIACVPFVADPEEMRFHVQRRAAGLFYRIAPRSELAAQGRVDRVLAAIDASEAKIAVLPELMLSPALLARWQGALAVPERRGRPLRWLLAGSGNLSEATMPENTAVLLDARSGWVIARQRKQFRFNMTPQVLTRFELTDLLGSEHVDEDIQCGRTLTVIEAGAMRVGVLICEDMARVSELAGLVRDVGLSHLLVPVFSRPLRAHRWEHQRADVHRETAGTSVVVSNSMLVKASEEGASAMLISAAEGEALFGSVSDPAEPVCFLLEPDGSGKLA
jgi:predicted amidohydrolase